MISIHVISFCLHLYPFSWLVDKNNISIFFRIVQNFLTSSILSYMSVFIKHFFLCFLTPAQHFLSLSVQNTDWWTVSVYSFFTTEATSYTYMACAGSGVYVWSCRVWVTINLHFTFTCWRPPKPVSKSDILRLSVMCHKLFYIFFIDVVPLPESIFFSSVLFYSVE